MIRHGRGRLVVTTHEAADGSALVGRLEASGVCVWRLPVSIHAPAGAGGPLDDCLERLDQFDWVVMTSARAVQAVCGRPAWRRQWSRASRPRVAAVGPATRAALADHGVEVALWPAEAGASALAEAMVTSEGGALSGRAVLWPRSSIARPELAEALAASGARLTDPVAYTTEPAVPPRLSEFRDRLAGGEIAAVTFLSPSSAEHLAAVMEERTLETLAGRTLVASVGPTTSAALARFGAGRILEAAEHTGAGLASRLLDHLAHMEDSSS